MSADRVYTTRPNLGRSNVRYGRESSFDTLGTVTTVPAGYEAEGWNDEGEPTLTRTFPTHAQAVSAVVKWVGLA